MANKPHDHIAQSALRADDQGYLKDSASLHIINALVAIANELAELNAYLMLLQQTIRNK